MKTIDIEYYDKLSKSSEKKNVYNTYKKNNYTFLLLACLENKDIETIESLAFKNKIKADQFIDISDLPKAFRFNLTHLVPNYLRDETNSVSFGFILALLNLNHAFQHSVNKKIKRDKIELKNKNMTININQETDKETVKEKEEPNKSILYNLLISEKEKKYIARAHRDKNLLNSDLVQSDSSFKDFLGFTEIALLYDNLDMLNFIETLKTDYGNLNSLSIQEGIEKLHSQKNTRDIYPKTIINYYIDQYLESAVDLLEKTEKPEKNKWYPHFFSNINLEKMALKKGDKDTFQKIIAIKEKIPTFSSNFNRLVKQVYQPDCIKDSVENIKKIFVWTQDKKEATKPVSVVLFEQLDLEHLSEKEFFQEIMSFEQIKEEFVNYSKIKSPNIQYSSEKIKYLIDNDIKYSENQLTKKINKKTKECFEILDKCNTNEQNTMLLYNFKKCLSFLLILFEKKQETMLKIDKEQEIFKSLYKKIEKKELLNENRIKQEVSILEATLIKRNTNKKRTRNNSPTL